MPPFLEIMRKQIHNKCQSFENTYSFDFFFFLFLFFLGSLSDWSLSDVDLQFQMDTTLKLIEQKASVIT